MNDDYPRQPLKLSELGLIHWFMILIAIGLFIGFLGDIRWTILTSSLRGHG